MAFLNIVPQADPKRVVMLVLIFIITVEGMLMTAIIGVAHMVKNVHNELRNQRSTTDKA